MRFGPNFLLAVTINECGVLDGLPSEETAQNRMMLVRTFVAPRNFDVRIVTNKGSNFSVGTSCK